MLIVCTVNTERFLLFFDAALFTLNITTEVMMSSHWANTRSEVKVTATLVLLRFWVYEHKIKQFDATYIFVCALLISNGSETEKIHWSQNYLLKGQQPTKGFSTLAPCGNVSVASLILQPTGLFWCDATPAMQNNRMRHETRHCARHFTHATAPV